MGSPSEELLADIVAYLKNEDGSVPELADLTARWDSMPAGPGRELLVVAYVRASYSKRAAWDGSIRLLQTLLARCEPIPEDLKLWACGVVAGSQKPPPADRNPDFANKDSRNQRIAEMYGYLIAKGWPREEVGDAILMALEDLDDSTVRKIFKKLKLRERFPQSHEATIAGV